MSGLTKRQRINCLDLEIIVLSETRLQSHLEHSESHLFQSFVCSWGLNPDQRHFAGTAVLARKEKFWSVQSLSWTSEHPCFRFHQDGCLTAVQLWTGHGGISIVVYGIYGPSGARWEKSKWQYFHSMLQAIEHDRIERGQIPSVLAGDFNLELDDSYPLKQCLRSRFCCDARERALPDNRDLPTCHVGKGSKIDHRFHQRCSTKPLIFLFTNCLNLKITHLSQRRYMLRQQLR